MSLQRWVTQRSFALKVEKIREDFFVIKNEGESELFKGSELECRDFIAFWFLGFLRDRGY